MNRDFSFESEAPKKRLPDSVNNPEVGTISDKMPDKEKKTLSAADYAKSVDEALETKKYQHWETEADREMNRRKIENYDEKKRAVDRASLQTQRSILMEHGDRFTYDNLSRIQSELGSNKTEIYNNNTFSEEKAPSLWAYNVLGMRDVQDGKICIKDNDDLDALRHVATHETMHDLSYQSADSSVSSVVDENGKMVTSTNTILLSGLHRIEKKERIVDGMSEIPSIKQFNRYLNEGFTELYTIEQMQARGEFPSFDSYTEEVGWAMALREKVGDDIIAEAYFGGDLDALAGRVNGMSSIPDAWNELNKNIDAYHYSRDLMFKRAADDIIDGLQEPKKLEKGLVRR